MGAIVPEEDSKNAVIETCDLDGVAPDDFYVSNIYPTEVRVNDRWIRVQKQRMDGAIVISEGADVTAECRILRDLNKGDRVVVGVDGIRTVRKKSNRELKAKEEF